MIQQKIQNDLNLFRQKGNPQAKILAIIDMELRTYGRHRGGEVLLDDVANGILQRHIRLATLSMLGEPQPEVVELLSKYVVGPNLSDEELVGILQEVKDPKKILKFLRSNYGSEIDITSAHQRICGMIGVKI